MGAERNSHDLEKKRLSGPSGSADARLAMFLSTRDSFLRAFLEQTGDGIAEIPGLSDHFVPVRTFESVSFEFQR